MYNEIDLDKIDINSEPPEKEPDRQYYFMAKCRKWVKDFEQKNKISASGINVVSGKQKGDEKGGRD